MTTVIGVVNQKGGVGKTTTSVNLAGALAQKGLKTLVIDLDAQSNLTTHLGIGARSLEPNPEAENGVEPSIYDVLKGQKKIPDVWVKRSDTLFIVPSSLMLSAADLELGGVVGRELILKRALSGVKDEFDFVIIDCPPALGLLSLNALAAVDKVIVPVQSEYLALHGVRQLLDTIDQVKSIYNPALIVGGVLICLHDSRKRLARAVADTIRSYFGDLVFASVVRTNVALAEAPSAGQTVFEYAPKSTGSEDYAAVADELLKQSEK